MPRCSSRIDVERLTFCGPTYGSFDLLRIAPRELGPTTSELLQLTSDTFIDIYILRPWLSQALSGADARKRSGQPRRRQDPSLVERICRFNH
eukprot:6196750-Pleurochrysis_carterae.AAC.3